MIENDKIKVRERILTLLRNQKKEERLSKSLEIANRLYMMREFETAQTILFYASFNGEVDTVEMMNETQKLKKTIALPCVDKEQHTIVPRMVHSLQDLQQGPYGIHEPAESSMEITVNQIDAVIVPGVAFDRQNNRLGRGQGYYDRFLDTLPLDTPTIGLCFDFQIVDHLPVDPHDRAVVHVLSN